MTKPKVLGITGGVASGKSQVTRILQSLGARVIDADRIGHEILKDPTVRNAILRQFGQSILEDADHEIDGKKIDRRKLASLVFGDSPHALARRKMLEAITHPPIRRKISQELEQGINDQSIPWIVLDVSLLLESGWDRSCDEIWFIDTPEDQRLQRALQRGWTQEDFHAREASQWSLQRKRFKATRTLWNGSTVEQLKALVLDAVRESSQP